MDNFEYSIQLNDRDWADFFYEAEECHLEEASLATADDQVLSDTDPEENLQEEGHPRRSRQVKISLCSAELGPVPSIWAPTVQNILGISDHVMTELQLPCDQDVLSGSEDEEGEIGSVSRYLCERDTTWQHQTNSTMVESQMVSSCASRTTRKLMQHLNSKRVVLCEDRSPRQEGKGWTQEDNGADPPTPARPNAFSGAQQSRTPSVMGSPIEQSGGAGISSTDPGSEVAPGQSILNPVLMADRAGAQSVSARLSTLLPQASEDSSLESPVQSTSTGGAQLGKNRVGSANFTSPGISHNSHQNTEGSLGVKPPLLENPGNEEVEDSRGEEGKIPTCKSLNGQSDIDNCHSQTPWFPRQDNATEETSLEEAANGPFPNCNGIRRSGPLGSMPGNQISSKTDGLVEDLEGIHRSVGKTIPGHPTVPSPSTCIGDPLCMAHPDWEEQEGPDSDSFVPSIPDIFPPPEDKFTMTFPETYDFFFCDSHAQGESGSQDIQGNINSEPGTSLVTDSEGTMSSPEIYEYFFCEGQKDDCMAARAPLVRGWSSRTRPPSAPADDHSTEEQPTAISFPEAYEYFFDDSGGPIRSHRGLFGMSSFRATGLPTAWRSLLPRRTQMQVKTSSNIRTTEMKAAGQRQLFPLLMNPHLTKEECKEQAEVSRKAIAIRGVNPGRLVIGQGDMCLVFLAFATWAVKTTDLQAPDAWKTALLANLGAVTAIRYLRRRAGGEGGRLYRHHHEEPPL